MCLKESDIVIYNYDEFYIWQITADELFLMRRGNEKPIFIKLLKNDYKNLIKKENTKAWKN